MTTTVDTHDVPGDHPDCEACAAWCATVQDTHDAYHSIEGSTEGARLARHLARADYWGGAADHSLAHGDTEDAARCQGNARSARRDARKAQARLAQQWADWTANLDNLL